MHNLNSAPKDGSFGYLNLAIGREVRPADRLTCHFEGRRQYLSDEKWLISSIHCSMKSRQHSLERARNFLCRVTDAMGSTGWPWLPISLHNRRR